MNVGKILKNIAALTFSILFVLASGLLHAVNLPHNKIFAENIDAFSFYNGTINDYIGSDNEVIIPSQLGGNTVSYFTDSNGGFANVKSLNVSSGIIALDGVFNEEIGVGGILQTLVFGDNCGVSERCFVLSSLKHITIGANFFIGESSFMNCSSLETLTINSTQPCDVYTETGCFNDFTSNYKIYVPLSSVDTYKNYHNDNDIDNEDGWYKLAEYIEAIPEPVQTGVVADVILPSVLAITIATVGVIYALTFKKKMKI